MYGLGLFVYFCGRLEGASGSVDNASIVERVTFRVVCKVLGIGSLVAVVVVIGHVARQSENPKDNC